jgi:hypothetical protein
MAEGEAEKELEAQVERLEHDIERQQALAGEAELEERAAAREEKAEAEELKEELQRRRERDHTIEIRMVVNGVPAVIKAREDESLAQVRLKALDETKNLGQPPENWEIKDEAGTVLDPDRTVASYHFCEDVTLFLSLKAGAAGCD